MKRILAAYLFLLVDLEIVIHAGYFGIILPLLAAGLLVNGFSALCAENESFEECEVSVFCMLFVRLALYVLQIIDVLQQQKWEYVMMASVLVLLLFFAVTHRMICAFQEIERENHLFSASTFCIVGEICLAIIGLGCIWGSISPTSGVNFILLSVIACSVFLLALYQLQRVYSRFEKTI